jgi:hypothetical protein
MRWRSTAVLAVVLAGLGVFYWVYEIRLGPERQQAEARKGRLFTAESADVTELTIRRKEDTVRVTRDGEAWQVLEPVRARGDRGKIEETITTLVGARADREIEADPQKPEEFGLAKPAADVTLRLKDGKTLGLQLGARSPTGAWVYAREAGKPAVIALGDSVLRDATRPVADFRDKTVIAYDRAQVTGFTITTDVTTVVEHADNRWTITRPTALPADTETVADFLEKLQGARITEFVAERPTSLAPWGLDRPLRVVVHTGRDKDRVSRTILFGKRDEKRRGVFAMRAGESSVFVVPEAAWQAIPKTVATLRDKVVLDVASEKVARLDIARQGTTVTLVRENDRWRITAPEALPADQAAAGAVVFQIRSLRAQGFLTDDASGIPRYLARPAVKVTVTEQSPGAAHTLLLAPSPEKRGGAPSAYAAVAGRGPVVLVDAKALDEVGRSLTELRDRRLVRDLEMRDVKRVRVKLGAATMVAEKSGERWRLLEPEKAPARTTGVEDVVYVLRALQWKEIVAPKGENAAKYGLAEPALEVTLTKADGGPLATVTVGRREGEVFYARTADGPAIYAIEGRQWPQFPKIPDDFKE